MPRRCPDCQIDLDRYGDRHRCTTKIVGQRKPTRLERDLIDKGQLDPSILLPKAPAAATQPIGRLAPRKPADAPQPAQARQPADKPCCTNLLADVLKELADMKAMLLELKPRPDA